MQANGQEQSLEDPFYKDAVNYWEKIPATVDGMLGGFGFISQTDIQGSKKFLEQLFNLKSPPGKEYAVDCGAGIGRITKNLLIDTFKTVDLVEQNPIFLEKANSYIGNSGKNKIGVCFPIGLQDFAPETHKYDIIWCQWVLGHLKDDHLVDFLERCKKGLKRNGLIVLKENITSSVVETDEVDSSVTRPLKLFRRLIKKANLTCVKEVEQTNFPKGLYSVRMFALYPNSNILESV